MRKLKPKLTEELLNHFKNGKIAHAEPFRVTTFRKLVELTAQLAYLNSDDLLFFRGQDQDYQSKAGGTTLYPPIYRGDALEKYELEYRFKLLEKASAMLVKKFRDNAIKEVNDIRLKRYIQWSILQHYEVTSTPLMDVTQSLRVACSFAQLKNTSGDCFVYVFGFPYVMNRISINSEYDLVNIRLLSICPPAALRPYFQEGYLVGTTDVTTEFGTDKTEVDFRRRLIAKFAIPNTKAFWGSGFEGIPKNSLYPLGDRILKLCNELKEEVILENSPGSVGEFMAGWIKIEQFLLNNARNLSSRNISVAEAIRILHMNFPRSFSVVLDSLRDMRNLIVHDPTRVPEMELLKAIDDMRLVLASLRQHRGFIIPPDF